MATLIIDMQPCFINRLDLGVAAHVRNGCRKLLEHAKANNDPVLIVEVDPLRQRISETIDSLRAFIPESAQLVFKDEDDGSSHVIKAANEKNIPLDKINVGGIFTDCCVLKTVSGLIDRLPSAKVNLVKEACNKSSWSYSHDPFSHYKYIPRINMIGDVNCISLLDKMSISPDQWTERRMAVSGGDQALKTFSFIVSE